MAACTFVLLYDIQFNLILIAEYRLYFALISLSVSGIDQKVMGRFLSKFGIWGLIIFYYFRL